jgi:hypothetical protein
MSKTIAKSRIFRVTVEVSDERMAALKRAPENTADAMEKGAMFWQSKLLPKHFEPGSAGKYGYAERSIKYLKSWPKAGKPPLVVSGSLRNDVRVAAFERGAGGQVTAKMTARVLNLVPNLPENSLDLYVKHKDKTKRGYPNLKRELKVVLDTEKEAIAGVVTGRLETLFNPASTSSAANLIGATS